MVSTDVDQQANVRSIINFLTPDLHNPLFYQIASYPTLYQTHTSALLSMIGQNLRLSTLPILIIRKSGTGRRLSDSGKCKK